MYIKFLNYLPEIREQIYSNILSTSYLKIESNNLDERYRYKYYVS